MHVAEKLSSLLRLKPSKPNLVYEYVPLTFGKYITIYNEVAVPQNNYPYFQDVIFDLSQYLSSRGITVVQIVNNPQKEPKLQNCAHISNFTYHQLNYIIKNSLLHISTDPFTGELCGVLGIPSISLSGVRVEKNTLPWFKGDKNICISSPKTLISDIKTEEVSNRVLDMLGTNLKVPYVSKSIGPKYPDRVIDYVPNFDFVSDKCEGITTNIRLDLYDGNLNFAAKFASKYSHTITCKKAPDKAFLSACKAKNAGVRFIIDDAGPEIAKDAVDLGLKVSFLIPDDPDVKLKFLTKNCELIKTPKPKDGFTDDEFFKSSKLIISGARSFFSEAHLEKGIPVAITNQIIDSPNFWKDLDYFKFFVKAKE